LWQRDAANVGVCYRYTPRANICDCLTYGNATEYENSEYTSDYPVNCQTTMFPICRYAFSENPVYEAEIVYSSPTLQILSNGQAGLPWRGEPAQCSCYNCWGDLDCSLATCCLPEGPNATSGLISWFQAGYIHGVCNNGQVGCRSPVVPAGWVAGESPPPPRPGGAHYPPQQD